MSDVDKSGLKSLLESRERRAEGMDDLSRVLSEPMFIQAALSDAHTLLRKCWKMADSKKRFADGFKKVEYFLAYVDQYGDVLEKGVPAVRFLHGMSEKCRLSQSLNVLSFVSFGNTNLGYSARIVNFWDVLIPASHSTWTGSAKVEK